MVLAVDEEVQGFSEEYTSKEELLKRLETLLDDRTYKVKIMKRAKNLVRGMNNGKKKNAFHRSLW